MHTNRPEILANVDYNRLVAEAHAERARMLRQMFRQARAYVAGLFATGGVAAKQN